MQYEFSGKTFQHPERIINETVIAAAELEKSADPSWLFNREALPKMMRLILEGPHEEIDWMQQEMKLCKKAYMDFFTHVTEKVTE